MADDAEKTEEPTPRKIEKARQEGNVPKSMETAGFVSLAVSFIALYASYSFVEDHVKRLYIYYMSLIGEEMTQTQLMQIMMITVQEIAVIIAPIALAVLLSGVIGNVAQFGFLFSTKAIKPKFNKLNPVTGLKNLLSIKKLTDGAIVTFKVFLALGVGFFVFFFFIKELQTVALFPLWDQLLWFVDKAMILVGILLLLFLTIAMADLVMKRYQYFKGLKMSKTEVKDEHKQMEGDPKIKAKIRQIMMQSAMKRMMQEVPKADVVVTNPTHYAVALRYDQTKDRAPKVVAKGVDFLAQRIKEVAREHMIQIVENPSLARELYKVVDVDREIPEQLYQAVAEVLAYVHKVEKRAAAR